MRNRMFNGKKYKYQGHISTPRAHNTYQLEQYKEEIRKLIRDQLDYKGERILFKSIRYTGEYGKGYFVYVRLE